MPYSVDNKNHLQKKAKLIHSSHIIMIQKFYNVTCRLVKTYSTTKIVDLTKVVSMQPNTIIIKIPN